MTRIPTASRRRKIIRNIRIIASMVNVFSVIYVMRYRLLLLHLHIMRPPLKTQKEKTLERMNWVFRLTQDSDTVCISKLRMDRWTFGILCDMTHKEAKGMWDFKFPYLNQLELVYGRDRATGTVVQGYVDAIYNLEVDQNDESGGENLVAFYHSSNVYEEDNNMYFESESTPTTLHNTDVTKFRTFVDGFNANFATIANVMAEENLREKIASERMKDVIAELMNLSLPSGDVFKAANIFIADKDKIDVLFNLPLELRRNYMVSLLIPSPNM
ncbi:hypothetical protein ZIOFF_056162 [Zingiber officinale]|uniref:MLLE-like domain-containing protein n=1 Tax=Zingiber officinale TaxID=94328 RepID=A0A8J5FDI9_ZINOF|nr:hypothetical protein ZIOFF_056162 [Zingiber officinale]